MSKLKSIKNHQGFMRYFKNTLWLFGEKTIRIFVGLFVNIWVIRYLGPEQFGILSYAQSIVALIAVIASMGLDGVVIRELVKDERKRDILLGTSFILKLFGSITVVAIIIITTKIASFDSLTNILMIIISCATIFNSFNVIDMYFQSKVLSKYIVLISTVHLVISSGIKIYIILFNKALIYFASVIVFDSFLLAIGLIYIYYKMNLVFWNWKFDKDLARKLLKDSWPMIFSASAIVIYTETDKLMIKELLGFKEVGIYSAASLLVISLSFIPNLINQSIFPKMVQSIKSSPNDMFNMEKLYSFMFVISLIMVVSLYFLKDIIFIFFYGVEYSESIKVFGILVFTLFFIFLRITSSKWYIIHNLILYFSIFNFIGAVINVILNFYFIIMFGISGAAYSSLVSFLFSVVILPLFFNKTREMSIGMIQGVLMAPKNIFLLYQQRK